MLPGTDTWSSAEGLFANVVARDGHAIAVADGHGAWLDWLP
jgi:hypothetical protein